VARYRLERLGSGQRDRARLSRLDDRLGERVLALVLRGRDEAQQLVLGESIGCGDGDDLGLAAGQRAGLVEHDGVQGGGLLQRHGVFEADSAFGAQSGADHDRRWSCQSERVGVNTGPAVMRGCDWYGSAANVAARLAAEPGQTRRSSVPRRARPREESSHPVSMRAVSSRCAASSTPSQPGGSHDRRRRQSRSHAHRT